MAPIEILAAAGLLLLAFGCAEHPPASTPGAAPAAAPAGAAERQAASPPLATVNELLKAGSYDDAAAHLLELQSSGHVFTPREAADYRRAMNEAYTRALEASEKGDARAEAALKMIRAANAH